MFCLSSLIQSIWELDWFVSYWLTLHFKPRTAHTENCSLGETSTNCYGSLKWSRQFGDLKFPGYRCAYRADLLKQNVDTRLIWRIGCTIYEHKKHNSNNNMNNNKVQAWDHANENAKSQVEHLLSANYTLRLHVEHIWENSTVAMVGQCQRHHQLAWDKMFRL